MVILSSLYLFFVDVVACYGVLLFTTLIQFFTGVCNKKKTKNFFLRLKSMYFWLYNKCCGILIVISNEVRNPPNEVCLFFEGIPTARVILAPLNDIVEDFFTTTFDVEPYFLCYLEVKSPKMKNSSMRSPPMGKESEMKFSVNQVKIASFSFLS